MRTLIAGLLVASLVVFAGCTRDQSGGNAKVDSFEVKAPPATALKQGESKTVKLTVDRGKEFKQNIKLAADASPKGIKVELVRAELKTGDPGEIEMRLTAEEQAAPGEAKLTLTATPEKGAAKTVEVKFMVEEVKKAGS